MDVVKVHYDEELQGVYGDDCRYLFDVSEKKLGEEVVKRINMHDELVSELKSMKQFFQWMNQDENIRSAVAAFSQPGCHSIYGLSGSVKSALVAKALTEKPGQAVLVVPSREQAAAWMADLAFLVPDLPVLDFPVVDKAVFTTTAKSLDRMARQMEALGRLRQGDPVLVLAAPEEAAPPEWRRPSGWPKNC